MYYPRDFQRESNTTPGEPFSDGQRAPLPRRFLFSEKYRCCAKVVCAQAEPQTYVALSRGRPFDRHGDRPLALVGAEVNLANAAPE